MDEEYEDRYYPLGLSMKPSALLRRQGYSTYLVSVTPAVRRKLLCDNAGKLYGLL